MQSDQYKVQNVSERRLFEIWHFARNFNRMFFCGCGCVEFVCHTSGKASTALPTRLNEGLGGRKWDNHAMVPDWVAVLPTVNAALNGLATVLLLTGFVLIKRGRREAHKRVMLSAFGTSIVFLACYLTYHFALHHYTGESGKKFGGVGVIRPIYFVILITHVMLAAAVPVLASMTIYRAWRQNWEGHRRLARVTFPIWVYVSVTGVIIYALLYHWPIAAAI